MRESFQTLWDLVRDAVSPPPPAPVQSPRRRPNIETRPKPPRSPKPGQQPRPAASPSRRPATMADRYEQITREMLALHNVRVRRWRKSMSGIAWQLRYQDGRISRLIEAPRPRGPMSAAVFLHEIGHHAIGFNVYKPRCLEEYHAWAFALRQMEALELNVTDAVRKRMHLSLRYAVQKAQRRGIRQIPPELIPFTRPWRDATPSSARSSARPRPSTLSRSAPPR